MGLFNWFSKKEKEDVDIRQFSRLSGVDRLRQIIEWGNKIDDSKLKLFQFLKDEKAKSIGQTCEPYYSMALSQTGIISIEEFENRVNK